MTGGSGAVFQVNGFRGGRLPSREEIRQIRFRTNSFSADNHDAGRTQIEIITRPNVREWSGNANMGLRSDVLNARNAFARTETPEEFRRFNMGFRGPIVAGKTSLRLSLDGNRSFDTPADLRAERRRQHLPRPGPAADGVHQRHGRHRARADEQPDAAARVPARSERSREPERRATSPCPNAPTSRAGNEDQVRVQVQGLIGKTTLHEIRVQFNRQDNESRRSLTDGPSIIVHRHVQQGRRRRRTATAPRGRSKWPTTSTSTSAAAHAMRVGVAARGRVVRQLRRAQRGRHLHVQRPRGLRAGRPLQFTQRNGEVDTVVHAVPAGPLLAGRHPREPQALLQRRRAERDAVAHRRQAEPDAARWASRGTRPASRGGPRRLRHLLRLVRRRTSTTRRCA